MKRKKRKIYMYKMSHFSILINAVTDGRRKPVKHRAWLQRSRVYCGGHLCIHTYIYMRHKMYEYFHF